MKVQDQGLKMWLDVKDCIIENLKCSLWKRSVKHTAVQEIGNKLKLFRVFFVRLSVD